MDELNVEVECASSQSWRQEEGQLVACRTTVRRLTSSVVTHKCSEWTTQQQKQIPALAMALWGNRPSYDSLVVNNAASFWWKRRNLDHYKEEQSIFQSCALWCLRIIHFLQKHSK